jgi:hypothetical protein
VFDDEVQTPRRRRPVAERTPVTLIEEPPTMLGHIVGNKWLHVGIMLIVAGQDVREVREIALAHMAQCCVPDLEPKVQHRPTALNPVHRTIHD